MSSSAPSFPFSISGSLTHLSALAISLFIVAFASGYAKQGVFELLFSILGIIVLAVYLRMSWHAYKHGTAEQKSAEQKLTELKLTELPLEILKLISEGKNDKEKISSSTGVEESTIYLEILSLAGGGYISLTSDFAKDLKLTKKGYESLPAQKKSAPKTPSSA